MASPRAFSFLFLSVQVPLSPDSTPVRAPTKKKEITIQRFEGSEQRLGLRKDSTGATAIRTVLGKVSSSRLDLRAVVELEFLGFL